jgi:hypothetical protein
MGFISSSPARRKRVLLGLLIGVTALSGLLCWRSHQAYDFSRFQIPPPPPLPVPNALDFYPRASALMVYDWSNPHDLIFDVADIDAMAGKGLKPGVGMMPDDADNKGLLMPTLARMQALMRDNRAAFEQLRQGFACAYRYPALRSFNAPISAIYNQGRGLERLLLADSYTRYCAGDWAGAMERSLDGVRLGDDLSGDAMTSAYLQAMPRQLSWQIVPHLSAAEAVTATRRLATIMTHHVPAADHFQETKWFEEAALIELFRAPHWQRALAQELGKGTRWEYSLILSNPSTMLTQLDRYANRQIARAKLPYALRGPEPRVPNDPVCKEFAGDYRATAPLFFATAITTQDSLLLTTLALQAYHATHHAYPATLAALAPSYLPTIPADPFGAGEALRYQRSESGYLLYSIGPDGKDNGGTPSSDGQRTSSTQQQMVTTDSTGDIVAGVNIQ